MLLDGAILGFYDSYAPEKATSEEQYSNGLCSPVNYYSFPSS